MSERRPPDERGSGAARRPNSMSTSLFQQVAALDPVAWNRFVTLYGPLVHHWCEREGVHANDRADVGQEVFRSVAAHIQQFDRRPGVAFAAWLRTITRNKAIDCLRRQKRWPKAAGGSDFQQFVNSLHDPGTGDPGTGGATESSNPDRPADALETAILAHGALAEIKSKFSEHTWAAFWETAVNDRNATDVAADLGMTSMAVRKAKSRVLRSLRETLQAHAEDAVGPMTSHRHVSTDESMNES